MKIFRNVFGVAGLRPEEDHHILPSHSWDSLMFALVYMRQTGGKS